MTKVKTFPSKEQASTFIRYNLGLNYDVYMVEGKRFNVTSTRIITLTPTEEK